MHVYIIFLISVSSFYAFSQEIRHFTTLESKSIEKYKIKRKNIIEAHEKIYSSQKSQPNTSTNRIELLKTKASLIQELYQNIKCFSGRIDSKVHQSELKKILNNMSEVNQDVHLQAEYQQSILPPQNEAAYDSFETSIGFYELIRGSLTDLKNIRNTLYILASEIAKPVTAPWKLSKRDSGNENSALSTENEKELHKQAYNFLINNYSPL